VASYGPHHGEEDPLRGWRGSGTIFFGWCNLRCIFCQNADISQRSCGHEVDAAELATVMLSLQASGCHNINFVSPSHVISQILDALLLATEVGLKIPLVYNTGGYDSLEALQLLDGVIDIYMPDMKYSDPAIARRLSKIGNYPQRNQEAVLEMHRQVGDLHMDQNGVAQRGLLVRHLVLPEGLSGTAQIVQFLSEQISPDTYLNLMDQYRPAYEARKLDSINRTIKRSEYLEAIRMAEDAGLRRLDKRQRWW
jgi:putative pyruvate formate lyase activating enzyme